MKVDRAYLVSLWLEAFFYGTNFMLVCACLFVLTYKKARREIKKFLVTMVILQCLISTTDIAAGLKRLIIAFLNHGQGDPDGPTKYLLASDNSDSLNTVQIFFISFNSALSNGVIIWRCYNVWGKSKTVITLPVMGIVGVMVCAFGQAIGPRVSDETTLRSGMYTSWNTAVYTLLFFTNVLSTSLVAFRILSLLHVDSNSMGVVQFILLVLAESGALHTAAVVVGFGLYLSPHTPSFYIVFAQYGQLASIVANTIFILNELKLTSTDLFSKVSKKSRIQSSKDNDSQTTTSTTTSLNRSRSLAIDISSITDHDDASIDVKLSPRRRDVNSPGGGV